MNTPLLKDFDKLKKHFVMGQHVIQQEVMPYLINGRKFVIRAHVLLTLNPIEVYVHKNCIILR